MLARRPESAPLLLALALASCAGAPEPAPLDPPAIEEGTRYFAGSVLGGRLPDASLADSLDPQHVLRCTIAYAERMPATALSAVAGRTRVILSAHGSEPLLATSDLSVGARIGTGADAVEFLESLGEYPRRGGGVAGRIECIYDRPAVLARGVTTVFFAQSQRSFLSETGDTVRRLIAILVSGTEDPNEEPAFAIVLEDLDRRGVVQDDPLSDRHVLRRQLVLLEDPLPLDGSPAVLVLPGRMDDEDDRAWIVRLRRENVEANDATYLAEVAHCRLCLRREARAAREDASLLAEHEKQRHSILTGLRALELARDHRPTLVFLTQQAGNCPLARDLALAGEDRTLAALAQLVAAAQQRVAGETPGGLAWLLERSAYALLARRLQHGELTLAERGMLARHAGEAGCFPGSASRILGLCNTVEELQQQLLDENLNFLNSSDPAARVRAYDWLVRRDAAPDEYDPLASRTERRKALRQSRPAKERRE